MLDTISSVPSGIVQGLCRGRTLTQRGTILIAPGKSDKGECRWAETFCGT
ncbi:MAG: hypothetical protein WA113_06495 [Desulfitobacteriaceae bacterium]